MCLANFERFEQVDESNALIGYRVWRLKFSNSNDNTLISEVQNYRWNKIIEGPHEVLDNNSGIYSYNFNNYFNNYNYYYKYYYNYNSNYYNSNYYNSNYYNYNYDNYNIIGTIKQYGKVAIHKIGQRSEYARINTLFKIRKLDAQGSKEFLDWIDKFNSIIDSLAVKYECKTINWQDFIE